VKLGLFGGSFDPFHLGHLRPVQAARARFGLERVIYLPTARPPHKDTAGRAPKAPAAVRYTMVELAILGADGLFASPYEQELEHPSYTVETLEHFRDTSPGAELHLIVGADSFVQLPSWRRWREIPELAALIVLARPGWDLAARRSELAPELLDLLATGRAQVLEDVTMDLSSTEIRRRLGAREPLPDGWLPDLVLDYVQKYDFYR
jgi:nicotinate-nucleotide adenylyltransferase